MLLTGWYLLKVVACSAILTGYYWLMLRNKLYHQYNRFFLMASVVLSLTLPLLTIHIPRYVEAPQPSAIPLLQTVELEAPLPVDTVATMPSGNGFEWRWLPIVGYALVSLVMLVLFIRVLWYIRSLIYKYKGQIVERFFFVNTTEKNTPFSFFNYIFWNEGIDLESPAGRQIFRHEVAHVQERHSHDKLFMNLLLIVFWSNPFFWLIRKELGMIHEFIADKRAVEDNDTASFAAMILQAAYPQHRFDMVNPFFYSPIKRRLLMLTKKQSPQVSYLSRILVLPLAVLVFAAFTFKAKTIYAMPSPALTDVAPLFTVVLDAGHGGADAGAYGPQGEREKDLALAIVQQVQRLNPSPNIRYVLSRPSDVQLLPIDRVQFCKDQQADLFISLHLDAAQQDTKAPSGLRVLVGKAGAAHGAASKLLAASLIQHFQRNYGLTVSPYPIQPRQGVMVLDRNHCPSVLIEAGFMSNPQDVAYLKTEAAQKAIAQNIMAAVNNYRLSQVPTVAPSKGQTATIDTLPTPKTTAPAKALATDGAVNDLDSVGDYRISASEDAPLSRLAAGRPVNGLSVGAATLQGVTAPTYPLIVVNGQVVGNTQAALAQIDVNIIREINVLKAASGVKQYGDQARHGVIEVITKEAPPTAPVLVSGTKQKPMAEVPVQVIPEVVAIGYKNPQTAKNTSTAIVSTEPADVVVKGYRKTNAVNTQQENQVAENATDKFDGTAINTGPNGGMPGGQGAWAKHLQQKLNTSIAVKEGWAKGVYKVLIQFVTDEAGHISDVKALNYQETKMAQHCIDIVKSGPQWEPAVQGGRKVKTYRQQPITFVIE